MQIITEIEHHLALTQEKISKLQQKITDAKSKKQSWDALQQSLNDLTVRKNNNQEELDLIHKTLEEAQKKLKRAVKISLSGEDYTQLKEEERKLHQEITSTLEKLKDFKDIAQLNTQIEEDEKALEHIVTEFSFREVEFSINKTELNRITQCLVSLNKGLLLLNSSEPSRLVQEGAPNPGPAVVISPPPLPPPPPLQDRPQSHANHVAVSLEMTPPPSALTSIPASLTTVLSCAKRLFRDALLPWEKEQTNAIGATFNHGPIFSDLDNVILLLSSHIEELQKTSAEAHSSTNTSQTEFDIMNEPMMTLRQNIVTILQMKLTILFQLKRFDQFGEILKAIQHHYQVMDYEKMESEGNNRKHPSLPARKKLQAFQDRTIAIMETDSLGEGALKFEVVHFNIKFYQAEHWYYEADAFFSENNFFNESLNIEVLKQFLSVPNISLQVERIIMHLNKLENAWELYDHITRTKPDIYTIDLNYFCMIKALYMGLKEYLAEKKSDPDMDKATLLSVVTMTHASITQFRDRMLSKNVVRSRELYRIEKDLRNMKTTLDDKRPQAVPSRNRHEYNGNGHRSYDGKHSYDSPNSRALTWNYDYKDRPQPSTKREASERRRFRDEDYSSVSSRELSPRRTRHGEERTPSPPRLR